MELEFNKEALEDGLSEMVQNVEDAEDWFETQRMTLKCGNSYEIQIIVTNDEDRFIGEEYKITGEAI